LPRGVKVLNWGGGEGGRLTAAGLGQEFGGCGIGSRLFDDKLTSGMWGFVKEKEGQDSGTVDEIWELQGPVAPSKVGVTGGQSGEGGIFGNAWVSLVIRT